MMNNARCIGVLIHWRGMGLLETQRRRARTEAIEAAEITDENQLFPHLPPSTLPLPPPFQMENTVSCSRLGYKHSESASGSVQRAESCGKRLTLGH